MNESLFSKFTPSLMEPKTLEAIFVQRERLVSRLVDLVASDAGSMGRHHTLMIGPRGIGKTFLMTLLYNRISANKDLADTVLVAWLKEEEWGVTSYAELLISIIRAADSGKNSWVTDEIDTLYSLEPYEVEKRAEDILERLAAGRMILLLVENLDMVFDDMGEDGQKKLRAFIQEKGMMSIIATSQGLFDGVSKQKFPFYGTFQINHLESLTIDEALLLLEKMAKESNDLKLAEYIKTSAARSRVRAVMHLSGGNHRVMAIFSQFLTYESLGELVKPFMAMIDELTPYYQSKMKELPAQQRKIVDFLCGYRGAAQVKEIARKCFLSHQASSSQLKALREKGYVVSRPMGRDSYYELAEPLMRLCVEVKAHRSGPVRLLIDLLRIWYSTIDLDSALYGASDTVISELSEYSEYKSNLENALLCLKNNKYYEAAEAFGRACELEPEKSEAWIYKGLASGNAGKWNESIASLEKALSIARLNPDAELADVKHISSVLSERFSHKEWQEKAYELAAFFKRHGFLDLLSAGLLESLEKALDPITSDPLAKEWLAAWESAAGSEPEFDIPLRIFRSGLKYRENQDERIMMDHPVEERMILDQILKKAGIYRDI